MMFEAFLVSTGLVAIGEIGDKTQLLSFALAQRYRAPWAILAGVVLATLINHGLSAWFGSWLAGLISMFWLTIILGIGFIGLGIWMLIPDKDEELEDSRRMGPFIAAFVLFFLAEIGDKTQIATIALAARYSGDFLPVLTGTTLGMVLVNAPVIWLGTLLSNSVWQRRIHQISALLFVTMGAVTLLSLFAH